MGKTPRDFNQRWIESFKGCCNTWVFLFSLGELGQSLGNCSSCFGVFEGLPSATHLERRELGNLPYGHRQTILR